MRIPVLTLFLLSFGFSYAMEEERSDEGCLAESVHYFFECIGKDCSDIEKMIAVSDRKDRRRRGVQPLGGAQGVPAKWREEYAKKERSGGNAAVCPFCKIEHHGEALCFEKGAHAMTLLNKNGTNPLHFLVIPHSHVRELNDLNEEERKELFARAALLIKRLKNELEVEGYHFFFNLMHRCSGASLPDHIHGQVLTRWRGDMLSLSRELCGTLIQHERTPAVLEMLKAKRWEGKLREMYSLFSRAITQNFEHSKQPKREKDSECILCEDMKNDDVQDGPLIKRYNYWSVHINLEPSAPGQIFVIHHDHHKKFSDLSTEEIEEYHGVLVECEKRLKQLVMPHGISIGLDTECAADPWPFDHNCCTVITPRWDNEKSSLAIANGLQLVPRDINRLKDQMLIAFNIQ